MPFQYPQRIRDRKVYNAILDAVIEQEQWVADHSSFTVTGNRAVARQNVRNDVADALGGLRLHDARFAAESRADEGSGLIPDATIQLGFDRLALPANRDRIHGINDFDNSDWTDSDAGIEGTIDRMLQLALWGSIVRHPVGGPF